MKELLRLRCSSAAVGSPALSDKERSAYLKQLEGEWCLQTTRLYSRFSFASFSDGLAFVAEVAALADAEDHHPELMLRWGEVEAWIWSHNIDDLALSDFVLAAKIQRIFDSEAMQVHRK